MQSTVPRPKVGQNRRRCVMRSAAQSSASARKRRKALPQIGHSAAGTEEEEEEEEKEGGWHWDPPWASPPSLQSIRYRQLSRAASGRLAPVAEQRLLHPTPVRQPGVRGPVRDVRQGAHQHKSHYIHQRAQPEGQGYVAIRSD